MLQDPTDEMLHVAVLCRLGWANAASPQRPFGTAFLVSHWLYPQRPPDQGRLAGEKVASSKTHQGHCRPLLHPPKTPDWVSAWLANGCILKDPFDWAPGWPRVASSHPDQGLVATAASSKTPSTKVAWLATSSFSKTPSRPRLVLAHYGCILKDTSDQARPPAGHASSKTLDRCRLAGHGCILKRP
ncbi:hypothetical protein CYMTET_8557 [Cymbomonas tetramitiformis]|uniref:Uncharacterized protein n=1 Tax=Cymbomonas tetramitiformis TaxID=36881 RepID=A0AAE0GT34_9CHLO|nr:hypothetical protein CYMTET_8557 [Cymbomonas tetramitiformis]